jgi:hypothetical protein
VNLDGLLAVAVVVFILLQAEQLDLEMAEMVFLAEEAVHLAILG